MSTKYLPISYHQSLLLQLGLNDKTRQEQKQNSKDRLDKFIPDSRYRILSIPLIIQFTVSIYIKRDAPVNVPVLSRWWFYKLCWMINSYSICISFLSSRYGALRNNNADSTILPSIMELWWINFFCHFIFLLQYSRLAYLDMKTVVFGSFCNDTYNMTNFFYRM